MAESTAFPWLKHLPEDAVREFFFELTDAIAEARASLEVSSETYVEKIDPLIHAWKATAEVHADPALYQALTQPHEGDFGEVLVPAPRPHNHDFVTAAGLPTKECVTEGCEMTFRDFLIKRIENEGSDRVPNPREAGHDHEQW